MCALAVALLAIIGWANSSRNRTDYPRRYGRLVNHMKVFEKKELLLLWLGWAVGSVVLVYLAVHGW